MWICGTTKKIQMTATAIFKADNNKSITILRLSTPPPNSDTTAIHAGTNSPAPKETYTDTVQNRKSENVASADPLKRLTMVRTMSNKGKARVIINRIPARLRVGFIRCSGL